LNNRGSNPELFQYSFSSKKLKSPDIFNVMKLLYAIRKYN
jgi:hypothetical protein